ncbi:hypothetical protein GA0074694_0188 [Micromonospora inyonensis]|uniref:Uncharacterized protein n=1 Tax=Micromonospora inyonensis TaxID=47866 RepID=A0A1C6R7Y5_9ACTN|nr:hypothetical protein GA0074694_0188 [Micromonospora inyonensis]
MNEETIHGFLRSDPGGPARSGPPRAGTIPGGDTPGGDSQQGANP